MTTFRKLQGRHCTVGQKIVVKLSFTSESHVMGQWLVSCPLCLVEFRRVHSLEAVCGTTDAGEDSPHSEFLNLGTVDILGRISLCHEGSSCGLWDLQQHPGLLPTRSYTTTLSVVMN